LGSPAVPEIRNTIGLALDLHAAANDEERATADKLWHRTFDTSEAELCGMASQPLAWCWPGTIRAWLPRPNSAPCTTWRTSARRRGRNRVFSQIRLASVRFVAGEPEQASVDGMLALEMAEGTGPGWCERGSRTCCGMRVGLILGSG